MTNIAAPSFGVEEEFLLLDDSTGLPTDGADALVAGLPGLRAEYEYFHSQLETATPVCVHANEAVDSLSSFRAAASSAAAERGLVLASTGLPAVGGDIPGRVTDNPRYRAIHAEMRGMVHRYYSTGTHVHVEVPSRDAGIDAFERIARWSPVLVALTANSPLWLGGDSGYASWRYLQLQQWPSAGYPPILADAEAYDEVISGLVRAGALFDPALVNWSIRLSPKYPTVELRTADAQLTAEDAVGFGLLVRAIVHTGLIDRDRGVFAAPAQREVLRGAHWVAARNGLTSDLVHPFAGDTHPAFDVVEALMEHVTPALEAAGDYEFVRAMVERRKIDLGGAHQQRLAWADRGMEGLLALYRSGSRA